MNVWKTWALLAVVCLSGCGQITYTVRITNNSPQATDFIIDEFNVDNDTFVTDVAAGGGKATVEHSTRMSRMNIATGTLIGQQLIIVDARATARVTDGDIVDVVKAADGSLTTIVTPASPLLDAQTAKRLVRKVLGR